MLKINFILLFFLLINIIIFSEVNNKYKFNYDLLNQQTNQKDMNLVASNEYKRADDILNEKYQKILKLYNKNPIFINKIKIAQRTWIKFRNAHIESIFPKLGIGNPYGSSYGMCYFIFMSESTWKRVIELDFFLKDNVDEICNGVSGIYDISEYQ